MNKTDFVKDIENKKITVKHTFNAPRSRVWEAWTNSDLLEKWFAPKPWRAVTKSVDLRENGHWHYYMQGVEGEKVWSCLEYLTINPEESFSARDYFCDEEGNKDTTKPSMHWSNTFEDNLDSTKVTCVITFEVEADMDKIIAMGFEEGFRTGLNQLDKLFAG